MFSLVQALTLALALLAQAAPAFSQTDATLRVSIDGVNSQQEQNIRGLLSIQPLHDKAVTNPTRLRYLHHKATVEITKALQPFGFYRPRVVSTLSLEDQDWRAHYQVTLGPPLPIANLDIQLQGDAVQDDAFARLLADSGLRRGAPLVHSDYEALKQQLRSLAAERGYYQGAFSMHRVEVDLSRYQANVVLHFDSGRRFYVGELRFTPGPLANEFLNRYVPFKRGDPVQSSALIDLQTTLIDTDFFQRVEVRPLWDQAEDTDVPIDINLEPHLRTQYKLGLGYGTDTGARAKLGMTKRWVNSRGHQLKTQLLVSEIRRSLDAQYSIPGENPRLQHYALRLGLSEELSDSIDARNQSLGISRQSQSGRWERLLALDWEQETFTFGADTQTTEFLIPELSLTKLSTKNRLNVRDGYLYALQLRGASNSVLSDIDFVQAQIRAKWVHSFTPALRFLGRLDGGVTLADQFDKVPATLRFFAGGDNSVRGYDYQSLGPKNAQGVIIGGPLLLTVSAEIDYRIKPQWGVAAFIDSGNAFEDVDIRLHTGIGVGLRWFSVIGPIRLDLAFPRDDEKNSFRLHFSLGPDL
ncbi:MAG: autotransporter assembly complex family protein [Motiliproteus sp.]